MSKDKVTKVAPKSGKKGSQVPRANGKRTAPIGVSQANEARTVQDKQTEVIDELARLAIELHRDALKELERY